MHPFFGEWYRDAGISPESIPLGKRWEAIESFDAKPLDVVHLTQLFFQFRMSDQSFAAKFRSVFNAVDPLFQMSGNDREVVVLAGAKLTQIVDAYSSEYADFSALCLISAATQNQRKVAVPRIPESASIYLSKRCAARNEPRADSAPSKLFDGLKAMGGASAALAPEFKKIQLEFPIVAEETNALWWLFGETSRDLGERFENLSAAAVCLVTAKELADLTRVIPGPFAARAFLDKAARIGRQKLPQSVSIAKAVSDAPLRWRQQHYSVSLPTELEAIVPINQALRLSVSAPNDEGWHSMFSATTGLSLDAKFASDAIAYQSYLEHLTTRCFNELRKQTQ